jgi:hypothetical protein
MQIFTVLHCEYSWLGINRALPRRDAIFVNLERIPLRRIRRGFVLWIAVMIGTLLLGGVNALLQLYFIAHDVTGPLPMVNYLFFLYSPFALSGACGVLFVALVVAPCRDLLLAKRVTRKWAIIITVIASLVASMAGYWAVLYSWVTLRDMLVRVW